MEKLSQRGVLKLTLDRIYIICAGDANTSGGPQVWAQINVPSVFSEYRIESNCDNQIFLEFIPSSLSKALKSCDGATQITLRLAKRSSDNRPVLSFAISGQSRSGNSMTINQEVLVRVLKLQELEEMAKEPMCPEPDVSIMLPQPIDLMRGVADRMKSLGSVITLSSNRRGILRMRVESELANVQTEWRNLTHPDAAAAQASNQDESEEDLDQFHDVSLEAKHFIKLLSALANGSHTICCRTTLISVRRLQLIAVSGICQGHCAIFYLYIGGHRASEVDLGGVLTFFVPGHNDGD